MPKSEPPEDNEVRPSSWLASRWIRAAFVTGGILLHGTLWVVLELGPFSPVTLAMYLSLFHPRELKGGVGRTGRFGASGV